MSTVLLIILLIVSIAMTGLILIQRSEGGALGIGGGGGGGFMSGRSATTSIARMTGILGVIFVCLCLILNVVYAREQAARKIDVEAESAQTQQFTQESAEESLTTPTESLDIQTPLADENTATETTPEADETSEPEETPEDE